jgi:hypothetical protein
MLKVKDKYPCPGHDDKCEFCKEEFGSVRTLDGMTLIDRVSGKPKVDPCCKACSKNMTYADKFDPEVNARFR